MLASLTLEVNTIGSKIKFGSYFKTIPCICSLLFLPLEKQMATKNYHILQTVDYESTPLVAPAYTLKC